MSGSLTTRVLNGSGLYARSGGLVNANVGTSKPLPISIKKYTSMYVIGSNSGINYNIRVGNANDENSTTSTPTIIQSGSGDTVVLSLSDYYPYLVIGKTIDYGVVNDTKKYLPTINESFSAEITEIYLM